jgi:hypothetical protein
VPFQSKAQAGAMFAAAEGKSNIGIPKSVGSEFANASKGEPVSPLPEYVQAQKGAVAKARTHRGRRSKGKGAKQHHADAKAHLANAQKAADPHAATAHLFKALTSLNKAKQASPPPDQQAAI